MPGLYIRDETVDDLAREFMRASGAKNKTEAVREALRAQLAALQTRKTLLERINDVRGMAAAIGEPDPAFDGKAFSDEQWEAS